MPDPITLEAAIKFLDEAASYFNNRPTGGEDRAHWSNVYNADNCKRIAELIKSLMTTEGELPKLSLSEKIYELRMAGMSEEAAKAWSEE